MVVCCSSEAIIYAQTFLVSIQIGFIFFFSLLKKFLFLFGNTRLSFIDSNFVRKVLFFLVIHQPMENLIKLFSN